jgi:parallel beta-helix repeat protein
LRIVNLSALLLIASAVCTTGCAPQPGSGTGAQPAAGSSVPATGSSVPQVTRIDVGPDAPKRAQTALIKAKAGEIIEFGPGKFEFTAILSLDEGSVTIRGQGQDKTILSFKNQGQGTGGEGLLITGKTGITLQDLAVEDPKGDAIKVNGTKGLFIRNVRTEWTGGPSETNGGYGLYPVLCSDVLIENCVVKGALDAGIYVGQSENIIVRRNKVEQNVAGIEIENCTRADVYENLATDNAGGILVFTMPDLPRKDGRHCRVYKNTVQANNHENFAPKGNIVATVPPGTGVMIMASDQVEVFDNAIENNQTTGLSIISYLLTDKPLKDDKFDPFCESIHIHDNRFKSNGERPSGALGLLVSKVVGSPLPAILYDGIVNPKYLAGGSLPPELGIHIRNNGNADFANFDAASLKAGAPGGIAAAGKGPKIVRDLKLYDGELPALEPVSIEGVK